METTRLQQKSQEELYREAARVGVSTTGRSDEEILNEVAKINARSIESDINYKNASAANLRNKGGDEFTSEQMEALEGLYGEIDNISFEMDQIASQVDEFGSLPENAKLLFNAKQARLRSLERIAQSKDPKRIEAWKKRQTERTAEEARKEQVKLKKLRDNFINLVINASDAGTSADWSGKDGHNLESKIDAIAKATEEAGLMAYEEAWNKLIEDAIEASTTDGMREHYRSKLKQ
jgi:hypothetical protein